jgi:hypothetical protein
VRRGLRILLVLLLSAELLTAFHHHHAAASATPDCAACSVATHFGGGIPHSGVAALPLPVSSGFFHASWTVIVPGGPLHAHILPFSQAPPSLGCFRAQIAL